MFANMSFCVFILTYNVSVSQLAPLASYVHKYPIIMYCLGLFFVVLTRTTMFTKFQYDVAHRVSEPHMSAKFHGLVLFGL